MCYYKFVVDMNKKQFLMPTAQGSVSNPSDKEDGTCQVRMLFDSCSQRSYLSKSVKKTLNLSPIGKETILINTFGNEGQILEAELVQLVVHCFNGERVVITAYCVDHVCEPIINQNIAFAYGKYEHLSRLPLADQSDNNDSLEIQLLIGLDHYWSLIDGQVTRGEMGDGPIAMKSKLGYVLSGPVDTPPSYANDHRFSTHLTESHILKAECLVVNSDSEVNEQIHKFWDYESIGVKSESPAFCDHYMENEIEFNGRRYEAKLPFKPEHEPISDNFLLCKKRLHSVLKRLSNKPTILNEYDKVIHDQLKEGVVEIVDKTLDIEQNYEPGHVTYLPHHEVLKEDRTTTKLRVVYDASCKRSGEVSLNNCLLQGPSLTPMILDILLRF